MPSAPTASPTLCSGATSPEVAATAGAVVSSTGPVAPEVVETAVGPMEAGSTSALAETVAEADAQHDETEAGVPAPTGVAETVEGTVATVKGDIAEVVDASPASEPNNESPEG